MDCFRLGWPMRADADFFCKPVDQLLSEKNGVSTLLWAFMFFSTSMLELHVGEA